MLLVLRPLRLVVLLVVGLAIVGSPGAAPTPGVPRVTLIGDSGLGALLWEKEARERIGRGLDLRTEIRACRKLAADGCVYEGNRPPSALDTIEALDSSPGQLVVLLVGYNDQPSQYADGLDRVMRAAVDTGVEKVVWVTLRASRSSYAEINRSIGEGAGRWPQLVVADWDAVSRAHDWFHDGIHLNGPGADGFAAFIRPRLVGACGAACAAGGRMLAIRTGVLPAAKVGRPYRARIVLEGGTTPYRLVVRGLPRPLHVGRDGVVTGRPAAAGTFALQVDLTDRVGIRTGGTVRLRVRPG